MVKRRRKARTPRLALVDFSQLRRLEAVLDQAEELAVRLGRLADDLLLLKQKRSAAASKANETRRRAAEPPASAASSPANGHGTTPSPAF